MILPSTIPADAQAYIEERLADLAKAEGVTILFAIESGSRAWGFASADSDYDVRFVYARRTEDYLSVKAFRDVIETPTVDDVRLGVPLDMNGWDIRKALQLGMRSNPVLHEWFVSPIVYGAMSPVVLDVAAFVSAAADRAQYLYHYDRMARAAWEQISQDGEQVKVKRYCYGLRPALTLRWLKHRSDLPAMDASGLCAGIGLDETVVTALADLFARKRTAGEQDLMPRVPVLDSLIADALAEKPPRPAIDEPQTLQVAAADRVFRRVLDQTL